MYFYYYKKNKLKFDFLADSRNGRRWIYNSMASNERQTAAVHGLIKI